MRDEKKEESIRKNLITGGSGTEENFSSQVNAKRAYRGKKCYGAEMSMGQGKEHRTP